MLEIKNLRFSAFDGSETINILYVGDARAGSNDSFIDDEDGLTTIPVKSSLILQVLQNIAL